jgi:hypothetical protein
MVFDIEYTSKFLEKYFLTSLTGKTFYPELQSYFQTVNHHFLLLFLACSLILLVFYF